MGLMNSFGRIPNQAKIRIAITDSIANSGAPVRLRMSLTASVVSSSVADAGIVSGSLT